MRSGPTETLAVPAMTAATLLPFLLFAAAASITPGPNNILVMSTTATRGLRAGIPIILGVAGGFGFMVAVVGAGLAVPLARFPALQTAMRWIGVAWLLVLAWKIARAPAIDLDRRDARPPMGFWGASAFQWINPKAWIMAVATAATYTLDGVAPAWQSPTRGLIFVAVSLPSISTWALLGLGVGRWLATAHRLRVFNVVMGVLLAASAVPALGE